MHRPWCLILVLAGGLLSLAFAAQGEGELERNRRLLAKWKADPEHAARLQRDLRAFYALPRERQEQIREIDRLMHDADPAEQARLWGVVERYADWLERLPEEERQAVMQAGDRAAVIRGLRQRQWIERLPRAIREELDRLPAEKRITRITHLRLQERQQRVLWQRPLGGKDGPLLQPRGMSDLPRDVQAFVQATILPRLNPIERATLAKAENNWPEYPKLIATYAERYPVLPEGPLRKVTTFEQLPEAIRERLRHSKKPKLWAFRGQGKWPDFALSVSEALHGEKGLPALGASRPEEFPSEIRAFLNRSLLPKLAPSEARDLAENHEGRWPEYPRRLLVLARKHHLVIPGMSLPGAPEMWEAARVSRHELDEKERKAFEVIGGDWHNGGLERLMKTFKMPPPRGGPRGWPGK